MARIISYLITLICVVSPVNGAKLNVPRVLLPVFNSISTSYELEVTEAPIGGCFQWTTTRPDIVDIKPTDVENELGCSFKAIVSVITKEKLRNIAVIIAEDIMTRQVLRCDVVVDVINSLGIITKTKELYMNEAPEGFYVAAYDAQGNEFSSLEGVEFDWKLTCLGPKRSFQIVQFMHFKESPYEAPPGIDELERSNKKGFVALLKGIHTGSAKISIKLPYEEYMHVDVFEFQISIVANLIISPMDVYIMIGDKVPFKIFHMNNGLLEEIPLPSNQYYFDVDTSAIAVANIKTGEITGVQEGRTKIVLHDKNIDESDPNLRLPSATLNVVTPAYMTLRILPYNNWHILLGDHHDIMAELYSSNDHKLHLGPGVKMHMAVEENFHLQQLTTNGSWLTGWAKADGKAMVAATLKGIVYSTLGHLNMDSEISAKNELFIYPRIVLTPSEVILPWDETIRPKYNIPLEASGGDEKFLWSSSDHSKAMVSQSGMVRTHSSGYFEISAAMQKNHYNRQLARFYVLPPSHLEIIEFVMNAEVGQVIYLHVALYAEKHIGTGVGPTHIPFTQCQDVPFKVQTTDYNFMHNKSARIPPVGIACANIAIVGHDVGTSKVVITYKNEDIHLEDSVTVSTFRTLRLVQPTEDEIVIAVGTTLVLLFTGGPRPSPNWPNEFKRTPVSAFPDIVSVEDITSPNLMLGNQDEYIALQVLCKKLGESYVTLSVINTTPVPNCKNQETIVTVKVICGKPRMLSLQPEIKVADAQLCPMDLSAERVVVQSYNDIDLDVTVYDENGRRFFNISSLSFKWDLQSPELGTIKHKHGVYSRYTLINDFVIGNKSYQVIKPRTQTGVMNLTATVMGYNQAKLDAYGIKAERPAFLSVDETDVELQPISAQIALVLVDDTVVEPNSIYLYNHPANRRRLSVRQGSGYYDVRLSTDEIAEVKYLEGTRELEIKPIRDGDLQVNLVDMCLTSRPAPVFISIVSVHTVRLEMADKIEVKKCISCIVRLYDENDNLLAVPNLDMIQLKIRLEREIVSVKRVEEINRPYKNQTFGEIKYIITGLELGNTKLTFLVGGTDVTSAPIDLQVFPPLKLYPRNSTLLLGTMLQIGSRGGPRPDVTIEYSISMGKIAEINNEGVVKGLAIGFTKIHARSVGVNPTTAKKIIYSEDTVNLQVIPINGIKIAAPLTRFRVDATVPVWATGIPDQLTPMILGSANPPFRYDWLVEDSDIVQVHGIFSETGMEYNPDTQITMRLTANQIGRTRLLLNVTVPGVVANSNKKEVVFSTYLDLDVFEPLIILSPPGVTGVPVLMAPRSALKLKTNMDSTSKLRYSLPGITTSSSKSEIQAVIVSVTEDGTLKTHDVLGYAMVLVTATDDQGLVHTLNFIVQVKPLHFMMLSLVSQFRISSKSPQTILPQGTQFELQVTYHDNTGAKFAAGTADVRVRTSRFDLSFVQMGYSNTSIVVNNKKPGLTMLKVWIEDGPKAVDYVAIRVKQTIYPILDVVTTGDIMCLFTPLKLKSSNQFGEWVSSDRNVIRMENDTRIARVLGTKEAFVTLTHSLHPAAPLHIKLSPIDKITMLPYNRPITNSHGAITEISLVLVGENMQRKNNLFTGWNCHHVLSRIITSYPYVCKFEFTNLTTELSSHQVFEISTSFNSWSGLYTCDLTPKKENDAVISRLETNITIWAEAIHSSVVATPLVIPFTPAIFLHNELPINEKTFSADLVITGLDKVLKEVTVTAFDSNIIHVGPADRSKQNTLKYQIRLLDYHWKLDELEDPMSVLVVSRLSEQSVKVHILTSGMRRPGCNFFFYYRHLFIIIFSMSLIFGLTFYAYSNYIQPIINVNVHPKRTSFADESIGTSSMRTTPTNQISPFTAHSPQHNCAAVTYMQNRSGGSPTEPVYGDPHSFYNTTTPELRRNRRFM